MPEAKPRTIEIVAIIVAIVSVLVTIALFYMKKKEDEPPPTPIPTPGGSYIELIIKNRTPGQPIGSGSPGYVEFIDSSGTVLYDWLITYNTQSDQWIWKSSFKIDKPGVVKYPDNYVAIFNPTDGTTHTILVGDAPPPPPGPGPLETRPVYGKVMTEGGSNITDASISISWNDLYGDHTLSTKSFQGDYLFPEITDGVEFRMVVGGYLLVTQDKYFPPGTGNPIDFYLKPVIQEEDYIVLNLQFKYDKIFVWLQFKMPTGGIGEYNIVVNSPPLGNELYTWLDNNVASGNLTVTQATIAKQMYVDLGGF